MSRHRPTLAAYFTNCPYDELPTDDVAFDADGFDLN